MANTKDSMTPLLFFIFLISIGISNADLIPSSAPCWVNGTVAIGGSLANSDGATLIAYVSGTSQMNSALDETGVFSFNSLEGNDGDTVIMKVCGLYNSSDTNMQFSFEGFCETSVNRPYLTKTINFAKSANGIVGCTCNNVCTGGYCVNPGLTGVCSSATYYCDNDDDCETAFGETSSNCDNDCSSGGGSSLMIPLFKGGGGGGSSGGSLPPPSGPTVDPNTTATVRPLIRNINASDNRTINVTNANIEVYELVIMASNNIQNPAVAIAKLPGKPSTVSEPGKKVYSYLQISTNNINGNINKARIKFKVTKEWLTTNGFSEDSIRMMRYVNNAWVELPTSKINDAGTFITYEAETTGFSYFAVTGDKPAATTPPVTPPATTPPVVPPATTPPSTPPQATTPPAAPITNAPGENQAPVGEGSDTSSGTKADNVVVDKPKSGAGKLLGIIILVCLGLISVFLMYFSSTRTAKVKKEKELKEYEERLLKERDQQTVDNQIVEHAPQQHPRKFTKK